MIARAWVPMDDTHVMFVGFSWKQASCTAVPEGGEQISGSTPALPDLDFQPNTVYRLVWPLAPAVQVAANDYLIDP